MHRLLTTLVLLAACDGATHPDLADARLLEDARITEAVAQGHIALDLGEGIDDPTVLDDARSLLVGALDGVEAIDFDAGHHIELTWLGKGNTTAMQGYDSPAVDADEPQPTDTLEGVDAFNPATGNEFHLIFSGGLLDAVGKRDAALGLDLGTPVDPRDEAADGKSSMPAPGLELYSWSGGDDDRSRLYGVNANVTNSVHRRIVQLGGGCTGTLVGPRHVVTAGHCLYSRTNRSWFSGFDVRAGANGTSEVSEVRIDRNNIPSGQALWYYTPSQWRATSGSTWGFDYGILVLPGRLGDDVGWMGRVTYGASAMQNANTYRRGYPVCNATTSSGTPRIDDPSPCSRNHLYGNSNDCSFGEYESQDSSGWSRIVHHSCDASAGDSGSPLYVYHNGSAAVSAVHFFSHCETTTGDDDCDGSWEQRPLGALRLTPTYRDLIGTFRGMFP